ncbi:MAG: alpha/beta hydrolase [Gammaproteobacteria bacterium]|nr:alpha/beta hydrolase [Gammaproteobacteria bacterium]
MKVIFSHGKESGPWGFKIKRLSQIAEKAGCHVESIDYSDIMDPDLRVNRLITVLKGEQDDFILVGSSMGGYVSLVVSEVVAPRAVFLIAPALFIPEYNKQSYLSKSPLIEIVHGWSDEVIPVEHSIQYAKEADCSLHVISGDHPLNNSIDVIEGLFESFLDRIFTE